MRYTETMIQENRQIITYYVLFASRYRRKVFLIGGPKGFRKDFQRIAEDVCRDNESHIAAFSCGDDYCILYIEASAMISPDLLIKKIKAMTSKMLVAAVKELKKAQNLWTRNYFIKTTPITDEEREAFLCQQKRRG